MLKGFEDFIMRGNLVETAVAFVIGGAFATVVTSFTAVLPARMASGAEEVPPSPDTVLPTEIRVLLAGRPGSPNVRGPGGLS
jgi:large conductance mechanosensitive channel